MEIVTLEDVQETAKVLLVPDIELSNYIYSELNYIFSNKPERKRILILLDDKEFRIAKKPKDKETFVDRNVNKWFSEGFNKISFQTIIQSRELIIGDKLTVLNKKQ